MIALWIVLTLAAPPGQHRLERDVEASLAAAARERLALGDDATVEVTALRLADPALLKGRRTVAAVELPPGEQGHGRVTARVTVRDDGRGKAEHDTWATARVDVRVRAVVARHRIDRGKYRRNHRQVHATPPPRTKTRNAATCSRSGR